MYRRFNEPTNKDVLALHEGFADIVALMQHFTMPDLLAHEIAKTRGDLAAESILGSLAIQFGQATGRGGALREAIGRNVDGAWVRNQADPNLYDTASTPHSRGAILVAAVFDAYLTIYQARTADLIRLATGGTGLSSPGRSTPTSSIALPTRPPRPPAMSSTWRSGPWTTSRRSTSPSSSTSARLITADYDLVRDDQYNYRVAFVEAFRRRGIHPENLSGDPFGDPPRTLSVETLRWQAPEQKTFTDQQWKGIRAQYQTVCSDLRKYADASVYLLRNRAELYAVTEKHRRALKRQLVKTFQASPQFAEQLGVDPDAPFEVEELRRVTRVSPSGRQSPQVVVALTQSKDLTADGGVGYTFRGGSTLIVDLLKNDILYSIRKRISNEQRQERAAQFVNHVESDPLRALFLSPHRTEPFAALHALTDQ